MATRLVVKYIPRAHWCRTVQQPRQGRGVGAKVNPCVPGQMPSAEVLPNPHPKRMSATFDPKPEIGGVKLGRARGCGGGDGGVVRDWIRSRNSMNGQVKVKALTSRRGCEVYEVERTWMICPCGSISLGFQSLTTALRYIQSD